MKVKRTLLVNFSSHHKREYGKLEMKLVVPPDNTATFYVPTETTSDLIVSGQSLDDVDHVALLRIENQRAVLKVQSGTYTRIVR